MRARLELRASDPGSPERAGEDATDSLLTTLPRRRGITLAIVGLGAQAGLVATPWLLTGVLRRLIVAERTPVTALLLADASSGEAALRKAAVRLPSGVWEQPQRDRHVSVRPSTSKGEPARVPREVIGTSLVIVAPLLHRRMGGREALQGPVATALAQLARAWGLGQTGKPEPERLIAAGHKLVAEVFCGATMLVDATWAGVAEPHHEPGSELLRKLGVIESGELGPLVLDAELVAPERVIGLPELGRLPLAHLLGVDQWLAHLLGLGARAGARFEGPTPDVIGTQDRWPHLALGPRTPDPGLAGRAITGLRAHKAKVGALIKPSRPALAPRVPGRFAGEWTRRWYGEERR